MNFIKSGVMTLATTAILCHAMAQNNFQPGYVINHDNDTIKGEIEYTDWNVNPDEITFRGAGGEQVYGALDIKAFSVNGEYYEGGTVDVELSSINPKNLSTGPELNIEKATMFLEAKVLGEKSLYKVVNRNLVTNFYVKVDGEFRLLKYKKYVVNKKGVTMHSELKLYQGLLGAYLGDCDNIRTNVNYTNYDEQQLERLFIKYYGCTDQVPVFSNPKESVKLSFGVLAGIMHNQMNFSTSQSGGEFELFQQPFTSSMSAAFGGFIEYTLPGTKSRLSLLTEMMLTEYNAHMYFEEMRIGTTTTGVIEYEYTASIDFGQTLLKGNLLTSYKFIQTNRGMGMFANLGLSYAYVLKENNYALQTIGLPNGELLEFEDEPIDSKSKQLAFLGGIGFQYYDWRFESRYESSMDIADNQHGSESLTAAPNRIYFLLSYTF